MYRGRFAFRVRQDERRGDAFHRLHRQGPLLLQLLAPAIAAELAVVGVAQQALLGDRIAQATGVIIAQYPGGTRSSLRVALVRRGREQEHVIRRIPQELAQLVAEALVAVVSNAEGVRLQTKAENRAIAVVAALRGEHVR